MVRFNLYHSFQTTILIHYSYRSPIPTKITTLKSKIRPDSCGATEFISSTYSYNILPLSIKKFLYKKKIFYYYLKHTKSNQFGNKKNEANKKNYKKLDNYNKKLLLNIFNEMKENNFIINDEFEYDSNVDSILFSKTEEDLDDFYTLTLEDEKELIQTIKKELENDTEIENELKEKLLNEVLNEINNSYEDNNEEISDETILENYFSLYINKIEPSITTSVSKDSTDRLQSDEINKANEFQVYHPGVIYHPITKKKNLYLNSSHSLFFKYFNKKVSHAILSYITQYIQRNILRYEWKDDDYILWDNRCKLFFLYIFLFSFFLLIFFFFLAVQHRATGCPDDKPRLLIRTTIEVDAPPSDLYIGEFDGQYDLLADRTQASIFTPFQILKTEEL